ncbi:MAG TPA: serine hydrolase [Gaiellaceae bacterium]
MALLAPVVVTPAAYEVSFGRVAGRVSPGTDRIVVSIGRRVLADKHVGSRSFDVAVDLPSRDVTIRVTAVDKDGRRRTTAIGPVFGLPRSSRPRAPPRQGRVDGGLAGTVAGYTREFAGVSGVYVQDLLSGRRAEVSSRVEFPAASTLKVAIAIEVLRALRGKPPPGSGLDRTMRAAIIPSSDRAANELLVWLGGSTSGGAAKVNATMHWLGMSQTDMYGGYLVTGVTPRFVGKRTTARDLALLMRELHLAAEGRGRLARRGSFTPTKARFLLYLLAHTQVSRVDRFLHGEPAVVLQKAGWITKARHDMGLVYWRGGVFLVVVLTWNERGVGISSDLLAGRVGRAAYRRFTSSAGSGTRSSAGSRS